MSWSLSSEALKNDIYNGIAEKIYIYSCTFFPSWFLEEFILYSTAITKVNLKCNKCRLKNFKHIIRSFQKSQKTIKTKTINTILRALHSIGYSPKVNCLRVVFGIFIFFFPSSILCQGNCIQSWQQAQEEIKYKSNFEG